ncbi:hypothetical protein ACCO45_013317 [Purpureocillium lilacinum]|uniref:Uncharacterized protein n=1 Tax=Purpureocillium lilacinum TaxID=33203 RepID=A0ACC4DAN8_PURLI
MGRVVPEAGATVPSVDERRARPQHLPQRPPQQQMAWRGGVAVRHPATVPCQFVGTYAAQRLAPAKRAWQYEGGARHQPPASHRKPGQAAGPLQQTSKVALSVWHHNPRQQSATAARTAIRPKLARVPYTPATPTRNPASPNSRGPPLGHHEMDMGVATHHASIFFPPLANYRVGYHDAGN